MRCSHEDLRLVLQLLLKVLVAALMSPTSESSTGYLLSGCGGSHGETELRQTGAEGHVKVCAEHLTPGATSRRTASMTAEHTEEHARCGLQMKARGAALHDSWVTFRKPHF